MTRQPRLPALTRWLLRLAPVPREARDEVEADLLELFIARRRNRGAAYAYWRLHVDVASLRRRPRSAIVPVHSHSRWMLMRDARIDLKYAARLFARQPAILVLTIVGLSLGLGISTAAFSIMNAAVLRGEGIVDSDSLPRVLKTTERSTATTWRYDEFLHLRQGSTRMDVEAGLSDFALVRVTAHTEPVSTPVAFVSGGFFAATGGRVAAGRPLEAADEKYEERGGPPPVVVSFLFWTSKLNRDPHAVGRTIRVGRTDATIVGVAERGFSAPNNRLAWMPLTAYGAAYSAGGGRSAPDTGLQVFGRLRQDATLAQAEAQLDSVASALPPDPKAGLPLRVRLDHGGLGRASSSSDTLAVAIFVFAVIGLVLLLACANVATVLVSTAITREREMGVRAALGASRARIIRQLITESLALGVIAAVIGLMLTYWALPIIGRMIEAPAGTDLSPDFTVFLFLGVVTIVTGVAAGLAPARHGRGVDLVTPLKGDLGQRRMAPRRLRSILVITQSAVAVLLIVMAALFVRASAHAADIDVGFDSTGLYAVSPGLGREAFEGDGAAVREFWARAMADLRNERGVGSMALVELTPFSGAIKRSMTRDQPARFIYFNRVHPGYFETAKLRVLTGRSFMPDEVATEAPVALISESVARAYWPDQSPLGQVLPREIAMGSKHPVIVGVVEDAITVRLHERNTFAVYEPLGPGSEKFADLLIRVAPGTPGAIEQASRRLRAIDPQADVRITSVAALVEQEASRPLTLATLSGLVGVIAIVMCIIGLYGLTASLAGQRTREMAVRAAIGAAPRDLLRLLMWDSLKPVAFGLAAGIGAALLAGRVVAAAAFFGVSPHDPFAIAGAAFILLAAATLAVLIPTRRAAAVDMVSILTRS